MKKMFTLLFLFFIVLFSADAQITIRSIMINPPGTDNGYEYFEISGPAGTSLAGLYFIEIEGDNQNGNLNQSINLSSYSLGTNGLLLYQDGNPLLPAPAAETTVVSATFTDMQNGTGTFALVSCVSPTCTMPVVGTDLDPDNDGTLTTIPWTSTLSAVSINDGGATDDQYGDDLGGTNLTSQSAYVYNTGTWAGVNTTSGTNPGPYTITIGGIQSTLTPGATAAPFPITLKSLTATPKNKTTLLNFTTATETNNAYFNIERSADGVKFENIGRVQGNGTTSQEHHYSFTDETPLVGVNYYRLKQVDFDGQSTYSKVVSVRFGKSGQIYSVYPNPATDVLKVETTEATEGVLNIEIYNQAGALVKQMQYDAETTLNEVPVADLSVGSYVVKLIHGSNVTVEKFSKQ